MACGERSPRTYSETTHLIGRPRLVVATTFPVHPPLGGGQVRAANLYRGLSEVFDIELVTLGGVDADERVRSCGPGLVERVIPKSPSHAAREQELERAAGTVVTDIAMAELYAETPAYLDALRQACVGAQAVVACHPYAFPAIREVAEIPVWYEAQDVEATLKQDVLGDSAEAQRLLALAESVERECCEAAELIWTCSEEDRAELLARYGGDPESVLVVPNGVALDAIRYVPPATRRDLQARLRLDGRFTALFIASWHGPNVAGVRELVRVARELPDVRFLIIGSVGLAFAGVRVSGNVDLAGQVPTEFKRAALSVADVALNPVRTGSGTNLKMLDYFGAGTPVISTAFGARGLGVRAGEHFIEAEPAAFPAAIRTVQGLELEELDSIVGPARAHVARTLSWTTITDTLVADLHARGRSELPRIAAAGSSR